VTRNRTHKATQEEPRSLHGGHRDRLRARFLSEGLDAFDDHQLLELILFYAIPRVDTNPIAHRLMNRYGSLAAVLEADPRDIQAVEGVGAQAAVLISMLPQITRRYLGDRARRGRPCLRTAQAAAEYLIPLMAGRSEEVFFVLCLDAQLRLLFPALVSEGTVKEAFVHPRLVVEAVIRHRAAAVILAHNHPGGTAAPSEQDRRLTRELVEALGVIGVQVKDHVIVAGGATYSFACESVLPQFKKSNF
jgi:DNA repair protein RadC